MLFQLLNTPSSPRAAEQAETPVLCVPLQKQVSQLGYTIYHHSPDGYVYIYIYRYSIFQKSLNDIGTNQFLFEIPSNLRLLDPNQQLSVQVLKKPATENRKTPENSQRRSWTKKNECKMNPMFNPKEKRRQKTPTRHLNLSEAFPATGSCSPSRLPTVEDENWAQFDRDSARRSSKSLRSVRLEERKKFHGRLGCVFF